MLHDWSIDPREYARHEFRRSRRHAFNELNALTTALVVVDMVPFFVEANAYARGIVANIERLACALRSSGGVVAWVVPSDESLLPARAEFLGPTIAERYRTSGGAGPLRDRLWRQLEVMDADLLVEKSSVGAFVPGRCDLSQRLDEVGVDTVLVAGTVANVCCESTARQASELGYRVVMVADANAAMRDQDLNATLHTIYRSFGDVRPTDDLISLLTSPPAG